MRPPTDDQRASRRRRSFSGEELRLWVDIGRDQCAASQGCCNTYRVTIFCPLSSAASSPPEDEAVLKALGVSRIYTPKDFDLNAIMGDMLSIAGDTSGRTWLGDDQLGPTSTAVGVPRLQSAVNVVSEVCATLCRTGCSGWTNVVLLQNKRVMLVGYAWQQEWTGIRLRV